MLFSEYYHTKRIASDSWFDPLMKYDTKLFIDPFLIFQKHTGDFASAHQKTVDFFNFAFGLIAKSGGNPNSIHYKRALGMLVFPEARELCLGYAINSTQGAGSSFGFSKVIASAIWDSIQAGIDKIEHFEELSIFNEGIGADRISDMTANILKSDLIAYTQKVCREKGVPLTEVRIRNSSFNFHLRVWNHDKVWLPINPFTKRAILLVPSNFIRPLPTLNAEDFWDYVCSNENETLRNNLSSHLKGKVNKKEIVKIARGNLSLVQKYVKRRETYGSLPYDLIKDPDNHQWYSLGKQIIKSNPLQLLKPQNDEEILGVVDNIVENFIHFIEVQKGYDLLWVGGRPRSEAAGQRLFMGIAWAHCQVNNLDISKEENLGSGPVDFKLSRGFRKRVLIEMKLARILNFGMAFSHKCLNILRLRKFVTEYSLW